MRAPVGGIDRFNPTDRFMGAAAAARDADTILPAVPLDPAQAAKTAAPRVPKAPMPPASRAAAVLPFMMFIARLATFPTGATPPRMSEKTFPIHASPHRIQGKIWGRVTGTVGIEVQGRERAVKTRFTPNTGSL
jgi:hypothetical protein